MNLVKRTYDKHRLDTIVLHKSNGSYMKKSLYSLHPFFKNLEYVIFVDNNDHLLIKACGLQIPKGAVKITRHPSYNHITISAFIDMELGEYTVDEDSNEDVLIVYKSDKI